MLMQNIRALLAARHIEDAALATWCGHNASWISKILAGDRGVPIKELGKIADFFGLTVAQLFQYGISPLAERRRSVRRKGLERRTADDRRQPADTGRIHPSVKPSFPLRGNTGQLAARSEVTRATVHPSAAPPGDPPHLTRLETDAATETDRVIQTANLLYELSERLRVFSETVLARHAPDFDAASPHGVSPRGAVGKPTRGTDSEKAG